ncbi:hypothetical protein C7N43_33755 [Sphingobacteriales bacterium UPWRP_1]|nr:hypothetical protein B6N25_01050 [Sphingobacteriales bacterium TSM_CSS]PSJ72535.1 hypothetical protein C7N43_33755 [Sphingobacteriales bacterium UPWRP_1]
MISRNFVLFGVKKLPTVLYLLFMAYHLYWTYYGVTSIVTTILLYITVWLFVALLLKVFHRLHIVSSGLQANLRLFSGSSLIVLFLLELFLKYGLQWKATYFEKNGQFYNYSPYRTVLHRNAYKNFFCLNGNCWLVNNRPFQTYTDGKTEYNYLHSYNSIGFADKEPLAIKDCPNLVVALGDSFTESVGTSQDSTWLKEMERRYNKHQPFYEQICTLNGGISGNDIVYAYMSFKETLLPYKPKVVLLVLNASDVGDIIIRGGMERFKPGGSIRYRNPPVWEMLCEVSVIFRHFIHDVLKYYTTYYYKKAEYEQSIQKAKQVIISTLYDFKKLSEEEHFSLILVFNPYLDELSGAPQRLQDVYLQISADTSLNSINLHDEFLNSPQLNGNPEKAINLYWPIDGHNNPAGYRLWGQILADCLIDYETSGVKIFPDAAKR